MPKTDDAWPGRELAPRLRAELDRVLPPNSPPRYLGARPRVAAWRLAPAMLAVAFAGMLALAAWAATGTPNPSVWTQRVETVINPPSPSPATSPSPPQSQAAPPAAPIHPATARPSDEPETSASPEPRESPEPTNDHSGDGGAGESNPSPSPSPTPDGH